MDPGLARRVGGAAFDRQGPLPGGGQHDVGLEVLADRVEPADPVQSGGGEHDGVEVAALAVHHGVGRVARQAGDAAEPGVHVAADVPDVQVGPGGAQLGRAARGTGAHGGACRKVRELQPVPGAEHVADVDAFRRRGQGQPERRTGGQVLERMHRDVAFVLQQGVAQGRDEDAGAAHLGQRALEDIAVGPDVDEFDREAADGGQLVRGLLGLGQGQFAGAGSDPDSHSVS